MTNVTVQESGRDDLPWTVSIDLGLRVYSYLTIGCKKSVIERAHKTAARMEKELDWGRRPYTIDRKRVALMECIDRELSLANAEGEI